MHGFLNIDKPVGITSFDVLRSLKPVLPSKTRLGHLGTLDPMASGVLPLAIGVATRLLPFLGEESKSYQAVMTLGGVSDTQDAWGTISYTGHSLFSHQALAELLQRFTGVISQVPPMYSAVHHQGQRLYELARQGLEVERTPRKVHIHTLQLLEVNQDYELPRITIQVSCSKGTYIRTLCHDIGQALGTGAFLTELRRLHSGAFKLEDAYPLDELKQGKGKIASALLPLDYPLNHLPQLVLQSEDQEKTVINGGRLNWPQDLAADNIRIYTAKGQLIAIGRSVYDNNKHTLQPVRVLGFL